MADEVSGTISIDVLMQSAGGAEGVGAGQGAGISGIGGSETRKDAKSMKKGIGGIAKMAGKFLGIAGIIGTVMKALHGSVIFSTTFKVLTDILSAAVDLLLMPLIPILIPLLQMLWPLIEILTKNFRAWATPLGKLIGMLLTVLMPFLNFAVELLNLLYKPMEGLLNAFVEFVQPFIEYAIEFWSNVLGKFLEFVRPVIEAVSGFLGKIFEWIVGKIFEALSFVGKVLGFLWDIQKKVWNFIGGVLKRILGVFGKVFEKLKGVMTSIWNFLKGTIKNTMNKIKTVITTVKNFIVKIFNSVKNVVGKVGNIGKNIGGAVTSGLKKAWPGNWFQKGTPYVPNTGPAMVHKGERIIPAAENAKMMKGELGNMLIQAPVTVTAHTMIDLDQVGSRISEGIKRELAVDLRKVRFGQY